jgi:hypothetical protein
MSSMPLESIFRDQLKPDIGHFSTARFLDTFSPKINQYPRVLVTVHNPYLIYLVY